MIAGASTYGLLGSHRKSVKPECTVLHHSSRARGSSVDGRSIITTLGVDSFRNQRRNAMKLSLFGTRSVLDG